MQNTSYIRVYADAQGESHFDEVEVTFNAIDFAPPLPPINFANLFTVSQCSLISGPKEADFDELHQAPRRQLLCLLQGQSKVRTSDGEVREFNPGDMLLVEDTTGKGHSGQFTSDEDVVALVIVLS
jgi:hypothetical protein